LLLEIEGIRVELGSNEILRNVSLTVERGEIVGLLGPNGSGKSTLLRTILGILRPLKGVVYVDGRRIAELSRKEIAEIIGYLPQESTDTGLKVREVVMLGRTPYIHGISWEKEDLTIVNDALEIVGLSRFQERKFSELSGGEKQKVLLARVFAQDASILLLDEPTSHLDISSQLEIMNLIKKKVGEGCSALIAIHDINLASAYCNKLILLKRGKIAAAGRPDEVITRENIREVYGIDVEIRKFGGNPLVIPSPKRELERKTWIHVICGGGTGSEIIRKLWLRGYRISAGVLNALDSDWYTASQFGEVVDEKPFSEITEEAHIKNLEMIERADSVVLSSLVIGRGNLRNLEGALHAAELGKLFVIEDEGFEKRNFAGFEAERLYRKILNLVSDSRILKGEELIEALER
jgi:iron complex transport system ATP-binding protein